VHAALAAHFRSAYDPIASFDAAWCRYQDQPVTYTGSESWLRLRDTGRALLQTFMANDRWRIRTVYDVEKRFAVTMAGLPRPIIGIIDLIADMDGRRTVIDWKTAGQHYGPWSADLSDQLTTYWLAEPQAEQVAFGVLLKTKSPEIQWVVSRRTPR